MRATADTLESAANGRFQSLTTIGAGGMGIVYGATDTWTRRPVALKLPRRTKAGVRRMNDQLQREAMALGLSEDRHICSLYDLTADRGRTCMVMERLTGESLKARLLRGRVTTAELLGIATQLASALQVIHAVGLVHQDIKPANVYVARKGTVKVLDFGIATWIGAASEGMAAARPGLRAPVLGSANYISPDRILRRPADPRSDLFSFGVVLYEMATGHLPFSAPSLAEMVLNVLEARPMTVRSLAPERPSALGDIVHRLLARGAEERYQSAGAVLRDLRRVPVEDSGRARRAVTVH